MSLKSLAEKNLSNLRSLTREPDAKKHRTRINRDAQPQIQAPKNDPNYAHEIEHWPATPRYLVAELEHLGFTQEKATELVFVAWHNATSTDEDRKDTSI